MKDLVKRLIATILTDFEIENINMNGEDYLSIGFKIDSTKYSLSIFKESSEDETNV